MQPFSVNPQTPAAPPPPGPPDLPDPPHAYRPPPPPPPRRKRRWFLFGCLPVFIGVVAGLVVLFFALRSDVRDARVDRSTGTLLPPNSRTTPVPDSEALATSCKLQQGVITRECAIITPPAVEAGERLPVVFLLHGFAEGPVDVRTQGDWANAVVEHRFILVTPQGAFNAWNAGGCCGLAKQGGVDDIDYLDSLIGEIRRRSDVDPDRIYMAGFSNGGMMTERYACQGNERIVAAASVAGPRVVDCSLRRPMPMLYIHGTGDTTVPYAGGAGPIAALMGSSFPPAKKFVSQLVTEDGCAGDPAVTRAPKVTTEEWGDCRGSARVRFVTIDGWTHIWPINGPLNATDEILAFFAID